MQLVKTESGTIINVVEGHIISREELVNIIDKAKAYLSESEAILEQYDRLNGIGGVSEEAPAPQPAPVTMTADDITPPAPAIMTIEQPMQASETPAQVPENLDIQ